MFTIPITSFRLDIIYSIAGLVEGDGSLKVPNVVRSSNNKLQYPSITIAFALKDQPLAE